MCIRVNYAKLAMFINTTSLNFFFSSSASSECLDLYHLILTFINTTGALCRCVRVGEGLYSSPCHLDRHRIDPRHSVSLCACLREREWSGEREALTALKCRRWPAKWRVNEVWIRIAFSTGSQCPFQATQPHRN